jgi:hypothetical protein
MFARDIRDAIRRWHRRRRNLIAPPRGTRTPLQSPALARAEVRVIEPAEDQDEL